MASEAVVPFQTGMTGYLYGWLHRLRKLVSVEMNCPLKIGNLLWDNMNILEMYGTFVGHKIATCPGTK